MMKKYVVCSLMILTLTVLSARGFAGAGTSGAQILQQQNGARAAAMGNAFAGCSGDIAALEVNPAGVHNIEKNEIMLMHVGGFEGISAERLNAVIIAPGLGSVGAQILYRAQPVIDNHVAGEATVNVKDMVYGLSFARPVVAGFSMGVNIKMVVMELGPVDTTALSLDLGTQYEMSRLLTIGLALRNLGTPVKFSEAEDPLPMKVLVGACYTPLEEGRHTLNTVLDVDYLVPEENILLHLGAEYWFRRMLALRMGYEYSANASVNGFSAGVGFRFKAGKVDFVLDYALRPQFWEEEDFETENLFTFSVKF
ncbi:PorV/PorQ family protein [bacterium]|nr:PorV/PorQ family protein [bacterium]